ncbi:MAG: PEP-CTERM sorting domain-containing protein [Telluria sp.]
MKTWIRHVCVVTALGWTLSAHATPVLYDNGSPILTSGYNVVRNWLADDFALAAPGSVLAFRVWMSAEEPAYLRDVGWAIYADDGGKPGAVLVSGSGPGQRTLIGNVAFFNYRIDFTLPQRLDLAQGRYWLGLDGVPNPDNPYAYWTGTGPNASLPSMQSPNDAGMNWFMNGQEFAFQILGVPEPSPAAMFALGLVLLAGIRRRV